MAESGTYALLIEVERPKTIHVGALGEIPFDRGWYAYVGSAFGPGGLSRVDRHRSIAAGTHDVRHWHVDYLLGAEGTHLRDVITWPGRDIECELAERVDGKFVDRFGASDCDCTAHLIGRTDRAVLERSLAEAGER